MNPALLVIPIVVLVLLPSAALKLAAVICRVRIRWQQCFAFGGVVALASIAGRAAALYLGRPPFGLAVVLGAMIHLTLGAWFVSTRGRDRTEKLVGRTGGVKVMIAYLLLLTALIVAAAAITSLARPK